MSQPRYAASDLNHLTGSLSAPEIAFYRDEGYLVLPELLSQADMAPVRQALEDKVSMIADDLYSDGKVRDKYEGAPFKMRLALLFAGLSDEDFLLYGRSWRDRHPGYFRFISNPKILDAVQSLLGPELFSNPVYNSRPKVPKVAAGAVPWHQDRSYWPGANANPVITVWVPLVDADEVNGCLHIWPRTHNTALMEHHSESVTGTRYLEVNVADSALAAFKKIQEVTLPLKAGGAILFNDRCIHMSTPNLSDHVRWSVDLRYQPTDQGRMPEHGAGFLCRSQLRPEAVATESDWRAGLAEHGS